VHTATCGLTGTVSAAAAAWARQYAPRSLPCRAQVSGSDTVLTGPLADRAALHGVLAEIEALGLELLEVRRLPPV
jgi:hypothetical protein